MKKMDKQLGESVVKSRDLNKFRYTIKAHNMNPTWITLR